MIINDEDYKYELILHFDNVFILRVHFNNILKHFGSCFFVNTNEYFKHSTENQEYVDNQSRYIAMISFPILICKEPLPKFIYEDITKTDYTIKKKVKLKFQTEEDRFFTKLCM